MAGIKFGDIDVAQIIDNEYRSKLIEKIVNWIIEINKEKIKTPSKEEFEKMQNDLIEELKRKYPNSGLELKK